MSPMPWASLSYEVYVFYAKCDVRFSRHPHCRFVYDMKSLGAQEHDCNQHSGGQTAPRPLAVTPYVMFRAILATIHLRLPLCSNGLGVGVALVAPAHRGHVRVKMLAVAT